MCKQRSGGQAAPEAAFALRSLDNNEPVPVLTAVTAQGRLEGALFELTLRQTYRNQGSGPVEAVYTFPLPAQAVLLGFASELAGQTRTGRIVAKRQAERQYEQALAEGDAPVMLEVSGDGIYTANLGNLKPGEEMVLEVQFAQVLGFEGGRLRLCVPTTIAPRYGEPAKAGLQPQQVPPVSLMADYPMSLLLDIVGELASASVQCPTHPVTVRSVETGLQLELGAGATLDRDVVFLVTPAAAATSLALQVRDDRAVDAPVVVMAAMQPRLGPPAGSTTRAVDLKVLIDCSGSMSGERIESAGLAVAGVLDGLTGIDRLSLTRFGSTFRPLMEPTLCHAATLALARDALNDLAADLGGTAIARALKWTLAQGRPDLGPVRDVLLVTDGDIWEVEETIEAARRSQHRVFLIGVGSSPAEGFLRSLAEATGGACEFVTPGEAMQAAAMRMLQRMRQPVPGRVWVDWGCDPVWQTPVPQGLFQGDTVVVYAGLARPVGQTAIRLMCADEERGPDELAQFTPEALIEHEALPRLAAHRRMQALAPGKQVNLAIDYQLMSQETNCILVHQRSEEDKVTERAELQRVASMMAAGWGGMGRHQTLRSISAPAVWRTGRTQAGGGGNIRSCLASGVPTGLTGDNTLEALEVPAFLRKQAEPDPSATLRELTQLVSRHLEAKGAVAGLPMVTGRHRLHLDVRAVIDRLQRLGSSEGEAWLLLAHWVATCTAAADPGLDAELWPHVSRLAPRLVASAVGVLDAALRGHSVDTWETSRAKRLAAVNTCP